MRSYVPLIVLILAFAGCGYRGPLYLPQNKPQAKTPPPAVPAPERPTPSEAAPPK